MKFKKFTALVLMFSMIFSMGTAVFAEEPYPSYILNTSDYDTYSKPIPAPYTTLTVIDFNSKEAGKLSNPEDMFIDDEGKIYVADTGNNRIVVYDSDYSFLFEISSTGLYSEGDLSALKEPKGVYVNPDDGAIIVADSGNSRIVEFTKYGNLRYSYPKPEDELLAADFSYQPIKVTKDTRGFMYVANNGDSNGIMQLSSNGEFISYYGTNKVNLSFWESLSRMLWSREDRLGTVVTLPYTFTNIYSSDDGYMYATTTTETPPQVRKINIGGSDVIYAAYDFRDMSINGYSQYNQVFCDVTVDKYNNMLIVDRMFGRIYEYDERGNNLFAFSTRGTGYGQLSYPISIETDNRGRVYVLNRSSGNITVYEPTEFANLVHEANSLYTAGRYEESMVLWEQVLERSNYYTLALINMGDILMREASLINTETANTSGGSGTEAENPRADLTEAELYDMAIDYFYEAENTEHASEAFEEIRSIFLRNHFTTIVIVVVVLLLVWVAWTSIKRARRRKYGPPKERHNAWTVITGFFKRVGGVMRHPIDGFEGIRYENQGSYLDMFFIMLLYGLMTVAGRYAVSFIYRGGTPLSVIRPVSVFFYSLIPWIVVCVVNYGVTTIMYGEGRFRDVIIGGAYCHGPLMFLILPVSLLTHVLTNNEASIYSILEMLIYLWTVLLVYFCMKGVHGFHPVKAFVVFILTALGVAAVALLFFIVYGLAVQMFDFIAQFVKELIYLA